MSDATPTGSRPLRVVRTVFRIVFALALVVLLVLIGIKHAPEVLAAIAPATPSTTVAAVASSGTPTATAPTSATPVPTVSVPSVTIPPVSGGGGGTGGGGGGGTTTSTEPKTTAPVVTALHAADVVCPTQPSGAPGATSVPNPVVTVSWSSTGATKAWFGVQTSDAEAAPYSQVGTTGNISIDFPCPTATQLYTITVVGAGGKASRSVTVRNTGAVG